jgi:putative flavoprotein involved in K+ transport
VGQAADVVVVGAGASGLAAAAMLKQAGREPVVLDRAEEIGSSWARRYDTLRLNTMRTMSSLPGYRIPRRYGRYPARDDVVEYLRDYARHHELEVQRGVEVQRIEQRNGDWRLSTSDGELDAGATVVATGYDVEPKMPSWPGQEGFTGRLLHARDYLSAKPFEGHDVLVVGAGNTGTEIAHHLLVGGAANVTVSMRTPPNIFPRDFLGVPLNPSAPLLERLGPLGDRMAQLSQRLIFGDLSKYGIPRAPEGPVARTKRGIAPAVDDGFAADLKRGDVQLVGLVERFEGDEVVLADGDRLRPDDVIAATGYARGLEPLVGHLDVLRDDGHPVAPDGHPVPGRRGLFFVGYVPAFSGQIRQARIQARRVARALRRR